MGIDPVGSSPEHQPSKGDIPPTTQASPGSAISSDTADAASGNTRANFQFDLPMRKPHVGTSEPTPKRAQFRQKPRDEALHEFLETLSRSPVVSSIPDRPVGHIKSLETIADESGVPVQALEDHIRDEMSDLCEPILGTGRVNVLEHQALIAKLYNLHVLGSRLESPAWLRHVRDFDSFVAHFCPQADLLAKRGLIDCVESFVRISLLPLRLYRPDFVINGGDAALPAYDDPGNWIRLNAAWVNKQVIDEARQLASDGFFDYANVLIHDTGSPALPNFAKNNAIWSAQMSLDHGEKLLTGEYAYSSYQQSYTSLAGKRGHNNVYTSRGSLSSKNYTIQRWFDESPVTFGISEEKQRAYDRAQGVAASYVEAGTEIALGPVVPLENVVAIAAPKAKEGMFRAWIAEHCLTARFLSYEAVDLLQHADKRVRAPSARRSPREGGFLA